MSPTDRPSPTSPKIVCLCGSTRFTDAFRHANLTETLAGNIVLTIGCDTKSDDEMQITPDQKTELDILHLHKIGMANEVLILNVDGYLGESTTREVIFAARLHKPIRWLEPCKAPMWVLRLQPFERYFIYQQPKERHLLEMFLEGKL